MPLDLNDEGLFILFVFFSSVWHIVSTLFIVVLFYFLADNCFMSYLKMLNTFFCWTISIQAFNVHAKLDSSQQWASDSLKKARELEELEVVEVEVPLKPVLHGTIISITSKDKLCRLRMSDQRYPVK